MYFNLLKLLKFIIQIEGKDLWKLIVETY